MSEPNSSRLIWNDAYSVGVRALDHQHATLVGVINELGEAMEAGRGRDVLGDILIRLVAYIEEHFATEERLMTRYAYPETGAHKTAHQELTRSVAWFCEEFRSGKAVVSVRLHRFLKHWLQTHVLSTDKRYREFFNSRGLC